MSIAGSLNELKELKAEIKQVTAHLKSLRQQAREAQDRINDYLDAKDLPGVKHQGKAYVRQEGTKRLPKKKADREADSIRVLEEAGVRDPERLLADLLEARRGDAQPVHKLKIEKLKI